MRIGLIQSGGIGDIIIALPIADFFLERGDEVHWPVEDIHLPIFKAVKPKVNFIPLPPGDGLVYLRPQACLKELGCDRIIAMPSYSIEPDAYDKKLHESLKFDEYKYAMAGVPFARKWNLRIVRDMQRETALKQQLNITRPYICIHKYGSDHNVQINFPQPVMEQFQMVEIAPLTSSPFDWLSTIEGASKVVMIDSCFSNLVEQLNLPMEKYFILRSPIQFTPVLKNGWIFLR
jgi:hypothetical protein